uniref:Lipase domain-containing protein n=1 Tax=Tetranychus urticae TaxID=32264 RepID=T1KQZ1_TETUR
MLLIQQTVAQRVFLRNLTQSVVLPCLFRVCYPDVGCFSPETFELVPILPPVAVCPHSPSFIRPKYQLYTANEPRKAKPLTELPNGVPLGISVHGFTPTANSSFTQLMKESLLRVRPYVMTIDWDRGAKNGDYAGSFTIPILDGVIAAINLQMVGRVSANVINTLIHERNLNPKDIYYYGHSFGAQMGHHVSYWLRKTHGIKMGRMTTLDPGAPFFYGHPERSLSPDDADYTDCIHSSIYFQLAVPHTVGYYLPVAHKDFYPNGGGDLLWAMPGCGGNFLAWCSHFKALIYYDAAIGSSCPFKTLRCPRIANFEVQEDCVETDTELGFRSIQTKERGIYFSKIDENPYDCNLTQSLKSI